MQTREWIQIGVSVVVFGLIVAGASRIMDNRTTTQTPLCAECNVVVIAIDTLRADHIHHLGYERDTTPNLDVLAQKGYSFSHAISPASWTVPTFMSIWTGLYPTQHRVTNKFVTFTKERKQLSNLKELSPDVRTLAEVLRDAGYTTGGFTGDAGVSAKFGYNAGFETYTDEKAFGGMENSLTHALSWLDTRDADQKFFMFFHGYDLHGQFAPTADMRRYVDPTYTGPYTGSPEEEAVIREQVLTPEGVTLAPADAEFWRALYDGKLRAADEHLGVFLDELDRRGLMKNTVVVVISDHGEEFDEHRGFDHGHSLYDEQLRVPLLFVVPGLKGGKIIPAQVTTRDMAPTLLTILGIIPDATYARQLTHTKDLTPFLTGEETQGHTVFSETDYRDYTHKRSVRTADGWKYILSLESGTEELYNLTSDPQELQNQILDERKKAEELRTLLRTHLEETLGADLQTRPTVGCLPVYDGECE